MPVLVKCPNSHKINVPEKYVGKKVKCPKCEAEFVVPAAEPSTEAKPVKTSPPQQPVTPSSSQPKSQSGSQSSSPRSSQPKPATPVSKPIQASPVVSEPSAPFDPFGSALPEPNNDPFADSFADPFADSNADPFADPFAQPASSQDDPWATQQGGYNTAYAGSGMEYAPPATSAPAPRGSEPTEGSSQPLIRTIMYVVGGCFGIFALIMVTFVIISLFGVSNPKRTVATANSNGGNLSQQPNAPTQTEEPESGNSNTINSQSSATSANSAPANSASASKQDLEDLPDDEKKKINVFGYDSDQRARLVEFLAKNNVNKLKGNVSAMMVAAKLLKAAKTLEIQPDENKVIAFPEGTKFEQHFNEDTLMKLIDIDKLPEVFVPLVKKYEKGEANAEEKKLAFFVLAAFYLTELK